LTRKSKNASYFLTEDGVQIVAQAKSGFSYQEQQAVIFRAVCPLLEGDYFWRSQTSIIPTLAPLLTSPFYSQFVRKISQSKSRWSQEMAQKELVKS